MAKMNKLLFSFVCLLVFISCSPKKNSTTKIFCENELQLLGSFENLTHLNLEIDGLRRNKKSKLDNIFQTEGSFISYKINHRINQSRFVLKMHSTDLSKSIEIPPPFNPHKNWIHIYLKKSDTVLFKGEEVSLDSIAIKVSDWYQKLTPNRYKLVNIALYWDQNSDIQMLNHLTTETINGYLDFVNTFSIQNFRQPLCSLSTENIDSLSKSIPFQLRTDFFGSEKLNRWDFIPLESLPK